MLCMNTANEILVCNLSVVNMKASVNVLSLDRPTLLNMEIMHAYNVRVVCVCVTVSYYSAKYLQILLSMGTPSIGVVLCIMVCTSVRDKNHWSKIYSQPNVR